MIKDKSIFIKNIYYMLSYAFDILKLDEYEQVARESFENMLDLWAAILGIGIGRQLKRGLYREYRSCREDLPVLQGKIDMPGTLRNCLTRKRLLTCEFDELSENNLLNQILKTTVLHLLQAKELKQDYKNILKREMLFFSRVETLDPTKISWSQLYFQRHNHSYRMLIGICQLIWETMLQTTDEGAYRLRAFHDERSLALLFEKFVLAFYSKECPQLRVSAPRISWALDKEPTDQWLPGMQSDIILHKDNVDLIIDTKFYQEITQKYYGRPKLRSPHLYQIFSYVKNLEADLGGEDHTVSGLLLYAATVEGENPQASYFMSGNKISVRTLDLNQDFAKMAAQLKEIVTEHFT